MLEALFGADDGRYPRSAQKAVVLKAPEMALRAAFLLKYGLRLFLR
jgi:hypothetical protein